MINAKKELLDIVTKYNLNILKIDCCCNDRVGFDDEKDKHIQSVDELDFNYDNDYGIQELDGIVYCKDSNDNPVWLTRAEYDGSEWWHINTIPEFYNNIQ